MKFRILCMSLLIMLIGGSLLASQDVQQQAYPEFYGFYVQSEGKLISLPLSPVNIVFPNEVGFERECVTGIFDLPTNNFQLNSLTFIIFSPEAEKITKELRLSKLTFYKQYPLSLAKEQGGKSIEKFETDIGMWVAMSDIQGQIGPIEGKPGMLRLVTPALEPGVYAFHSSSLFNKIIAGPYPDVDMTKLSAVSFSINIDKVEIEPMAKKPIGNLLVSNTLGYGRIEATEENIKRILGIARDYLKTRTSATGGLVASARHAWAEHAVLPQLNRALQALLQALRWSESASLVETTALINEWKTDLENANRLITEGTSFWWATKSFDLEKKVRKEIERYISPKKK